MSILGQQTKIDPVNTFYLEAVDGLKTSITGGFSDGTGSAYSGYGYSQDFATSPTQFTASLNNFLMEPNTTYLINVVFDFGVIDYDVSTGGYFEIYYGNPSTNPSALLIGKSFFSLQSYNGNTVGCNVSFSFAYTDSAEFAGIYFVMYQQGSGTTITTEENITLYANFYAITTKANTVSDNGLTFWNVA